MTAAPPKWVLALSVVVIIVVAVIAWYLTPPGSIRSNAPLIFTLATYPALCLYTGCPHKHRKLPSVDSFVVSATSVLVVLDAARSTLSLWGTGEMDKTKIVAPVVFGIAGLKALQRAFVMADEQKGEPRHQ